MDSRHERQFVWRDPPLPCCHWIPMNTDDMHELVPVCIRREQRRQHSRSRRDQRPARPPDVEAVRRREWGHRCSLTRAFDSERSDRQPAFNQAGVRHRSVHRAAEVPRCRPNCPRKSNALRHRPSPSRRSIQLPTWAFLAHRCQPDVSAATGPWRRFRSTPASRRHHAAQPPRPTRSTNSTSVVTSTSIPRRLTAAPSRFVEGLDSAAVAARSEQPQRRQHAAPGPLCITSPAPLPVPVVTLDTCQIHLLGGSSRIRSATGPK